MESFLTNYRENFVYPYFVPLLVKASQPPQVTKPPGVFDLGKRSGHCDCGMHSFDPMKKQVTDLYNKEQKLLNEFEKLSLERRRLDVAMLEHPCANIDDAMKSLYEVNYSRKGFPIVPYRALHPDSDDVLPTPVIELRTGLNNGRRDPNSFRYSAIVRPTISSATPVDITAEPILNHYWTFGRSEYMDTFSKDGLSNILSMEQYKEPFPSSRRRFGDPCL